MVASNNTLLIVLLTKFSITFFLHYKNSKFHMLKIFMIVLILTRVTGKKMASERNDLVPPSDLNV